MDISSIYEAQRARVLTAYGDLVTGARVLRLESGVPLKLRLEIIDGSVVDIFYSVTGKYAYHWERTLIDGTIYRHDNAPHRRWRDIATFPKHFHDGAEDAVRESYLSDNPVVALDMFLSYVRQKLSEIPPRGSDANRSEASPPSP